MLTPEQVRIYAGLGLPALEGLAGRTDTTIDDFVVAGLKAILADDTALGLFTEQLNALFGLVIPGGKLSEDQVEAIRSVIAAMPRS